MGTAAVQLQGRQTEGQGSEAKALLPKDLLYQGCWQKMPPPSGLGFLLIILENTPTDCPEACLLINSRSSLVNNQDYPLYSIIRSGFFFTYWNIGKIILKFKTVIPNSGLHREKEAGADLVGSKGEPLNHGVPLVFEPDNSASTVF